MVTLSQAQIDAFHKNGFMWLDSITCPAEVEHLLKAYDQLFTLQAGREKGDHFDLAGPDEDGTEASLPQILKPRAYAPEFQNTIFETNALAIATQLLGPAATFREDHAILKPAHHGAPTPWHQDEAYWDPNFEYASVSFWMPLQAATIENGCMEFIPQESDMAVLPHRSIGGDPRVHGLETTCKIDTSKAVACPIPAGGVTIHKSRTLHYAGPNKSGMPRRAYILSFSTPQLHRDCGIKKFAWNEEGHTRREERANSSQTTEN